MMDLSAIELPEPYYHHNGVRYLTPREGLLIYTLVDAGVQQAAIADLLGVSANTIYYRIRNRGKFERLYAHSRADWLGVSLGGRPPGRVASPRTTQINPWVTKAWSSSPSERKTIYG